MANKIPEITKVKGGAVIKFDVTGNYDITRDLDDGEINLQSIVLKSGNIINSIRIYPDIVAILNSRGGMENVNGSYLYVLKHSDRDYYAVGIAFEDQPERVYFGAKVGFGAKLFSSWPMLLLGKAAQIITFGYMDGYHEFKALNQIAKISDYLKKTNKEIIYL